MTRYVFDIETDGLLEQLTVIHSLCILSALMTGFRVVKDNITIVLAALLFVAWQTIKVMRLRSEKLKNKVENYQIKEEADAYRNKPVARDKSSILDRM